MSHFSGRTEEVFVKAEKEEFLGVRKNEDELTKILMSKQDVVLDKMNRQIIFGPDGMPILDPR